MGIAWAFCWLGPGACKVEDDIFSLNKGYRDLDRYSFSQSIVVVRCMICPKDFVFFFRKAWNRGYLYLNCMKTIHSLIQTSMISA